MTRGLMTLHSDKLIMREDAEGFQHGTATVGPGKLVHIRQEDPAKFEVIEAQGLRSEYNGKKEELEMIGQAVITRYVCGKPFDNVTGERVIYRQKTDKIGRAHVGNQATNAHPVCRLMFEENKI